MSKQILDRVFSKFSLKEHLELTEQQKELLNEYYCLITSSSISPDEEVERICEIWSQAENEPKLIQFLEIIDYLFTNIPEEDEKSEGDRRAYYGEYVELLAEQEQKGKKTTAILNENFTGDASFLKPPELLECPTGSFSFASFSPEDRLCPQCNHKIVEHKRVSLKNNPTPSNK